MCKIPVVHKTIKPAHLSPTRVLQSNGRPVQGHADARHYTSSLSSVVMSMKLTAENLVERPVQMFWSVTRATPGQALAEEFQDFSHLHSLVVSLFDSVGHWVRWGSCLNFKCIGSEPCRAIDWKDIYINVKMSRCTRKSGKGAKQASGCIMRVCTNLTGMLLF